MYKCKECKRFRRCTRAQTLYVFSNAPTVYYCDHFKKRHVSRINWPVVAVYGSCLAFWAGVVWIALKLF